MTMLLIAGLILLAVSTALVVRAIIRDRRERARSRVALVSYHARRSREIGAAIRAMGDEADKVFPPAHNGGTRP